MTLTAKQLEPFLHNLRGWLSKPNIVGLHVGPKTVGGQETSRPSIVVHVVRKLRPEALGPGDFLIPSSVEMHVQEPNGDISTVSVPTDVIEVGVERLQVLNQRVRPAPGAYQIQAANIAGTGTLGVNIVWAGKYRLLTNNHVISENGNLGAFVYQPEPGRDNVLGTVDGYVPVTTYPGKDTPHPLFNQQDLAYCNVTPERASPDILELGKPRGLRAPVDGEWVRLIGKQTARVRRARIVSTKAYKVIEWMPGRWAFFDHIVQLDSVVTQPGDSGTAYVAESDGRVVGLHMAANAAHSWGCALYPF